MTNVKNNVDEMYGDMMFLKALCKLGGSKEYDLVREGSKMYTVLTNIGSLVNKVPEKFKETDLYSKLHLCFITFPKTRLYDTEELKWLLTGFSLKVTMEGLWFKSGLNNDIAHYNDTFLVTFEELEYLTKWFE